MAGSAIENHVINTVPGLSDRIAIYLPSLRGGGAERSTVTLANGIAARGYHVDLVLASADGPYIRDVSNSIRILDLHAHRVIFSLPRLVAYLRCERPKAMLSVMNYANVVALMASRFAGVDTRMVISERVTPTSFGFKPRYKREKLLPWLMRHMYSRADGIVCVSEGVADDMASILHIPKSRTIVIYNPIVTEGLIALSYASPDHPWLMSEQPPIILAVGRLTAQKDFTTLIRAFAKLRTLRNMRLVILGEGEMRPDLEALIVSLNLGNDILLPGFVANPFVWMRRSVLYVLSSLFEGLPGTLIQAMACGTPVVSTNCPSGPAEILENGKWGHLVPVGNSDALFQAMAMTLDEPIKPDVCARAAAFGLDQAVNGYLRVLGISMVD